MGDRGASGHTTHSVKGILPGEAPENVVVGKAQKTAMAYVRAATDLSLLSLSRRQFAKAIERFPGLKLSVTEMIDARTLANMMAPMATPMSFNFEIDYDQFATHTDDTTDAAGEAGVAKVIELGGLLDFELMSPPAPSSVSPTVQEGSADATTSITTGAFPYNP